MTTADFFFVSAGLGIWIVVATWVFIIYFIIRLISDAKSEVKSAKNSLKLGGLNLVSKILGSTKGGENNDSSR